MRRGKAAVDQGLRKQRPAYFAKRKRVESPGPPLQ
jgi:hypothetical protein